MEDLDRHPRDRSAPLAHESPTTRAVRQATSRRAGDGARCWRGCSSRPTPGAAWPPPAVAVVLLGAVTRGASPSSPCAGLLWPFAAFSIGLYRSDQLATWASAVTEVPRGFVAVLLITWPLFGDRLVLALRRGGRLTFLTVAGIAGLRRSRPHRRPGRPAPRARPAPAHADPRLGHGRRPGRREAPQQRPVRPGSRSASSTTTSTTSAAPDLPWLGRFDDLDAIIEAQNIDRVIIAFSRASHEELLESIRACRDAGVAVDVVPRLFEFLDGVRALDQVGGLPLLSIGAPILDLRLDGREARASTSSARAALITVLSPLMLAIAIAIKVESRGPVFFRQPRAGRGNSSFQLIKFRSMYVDAEQRKTEIDELNEADDGVMFKIREDPRVTRVGRFMRRFSLDELPQLFNVLKGEMSLVGPRPLIFPETAALDEDWHLRRLELRPGLTGPWQVYGRSQSPFQEMVRFDYQYVAGWSLARDIEILLARSPRVLRGVAPTNAAASRSPTTTCLSSAGPSEPSPRSRPAGRRRRSPPCSTTRPRGRLRRARRAHLRLQRLGVSQRSFRYLLPSSRAPRGGCRSAGYDLVVSSSSAFAHGVRRRTGRVTSATATARSATPGTSASGRWPRAPRAARRRCARADRVRAGTLRRRSG